MRLIMLNLFVVSNPESLPVSDWKYSTGTDLAAVYLWALEA